MNKDVYKLCLNLSKLCLEYYGFFFSRHDTPVRMLRWLLVISTCTWAFPVAARGHEQSTETRYHNCVRKLASCGFLASVRLSCFSFWYRAADAVDWAAYPSCNMRKTKAPFLRTSNEISLLLKSPRTANWNPSGTLKLWTDRNTETLCYLFSFSFVIASMGVARRGLGARPPKGVEKNCKTVFVVQKRQMYT